MEKISKHDVLIVGHGYMNDEEEYFLIKNSSGTRWGHLGFAKVRRLR